MNYFVLKKSFLNKMKNTIKEYHFQVKWIRKFIKFHFQIIC